jgi:hypothetical protein
MSKVYGSARAPIVLPKDLLALYDFAANRIGPEKPIDYFEFGVAHGKSMSAIAERFVHPESRFYGFDSFHGLPEKWLMHDVGAFTRNGILPEMGDSRVEFVVGWFQNSLPDFFSTFRKDAARVSLVHFDADLYSSTLFILAFLWSQLDNYWFLMDDFIYDEVIALRDFASAFPVEFEFFAQTKGGGEPPNPDQVFGFMKRTKFVLQEQAGSGD